MPRIELTPSQLSSAREIADKAARIMEEKPTVGLEPYDYNHGALSRGGYWKWDCDVADWFPRFSIDGTDPDEDAKACARMKERLIEWLPKASVLESNYCTLRGRVAGREWYFAINLHAYTFAPIEALAVAQALIAVDEQRRREGK